MGKGGSLPCTVCLRARSFQSCLTLCNPVDYSPLGSSLHGILQARLLEWVAMPSSRDLPNPGIEPTSLTSPALAGGLFTTYATWEALPDTLLFTKPQAFFRFPHVFHWCPLFSCPGFHINQSSYLLPLPQSDSFWIFPFLS